MQKIPMGQQRDAVSEAYLNRIYAEVLNSTHGMLEREAFGRQWVKRAIEHPQIKPEAVKATMTGRYGSAKAVLATLDGDANLRASEAGYGAINPGGLSEKEKEAFQKHAGVRPSEEVFPTPTPPRPITTLIPVPTRLDSPNGLPRWLANAASPRTFSSSANLLTSGSPIALHPLQIQTCGSTRRVLVKRSSSRLMGPPNTGICCSTNWATPCPTNLRWDTAKSGGKG